MKKLLSAYSKSFSMVWLNLQLSSLMVFGAPIAFDVIKYFLKGSQECLCSCYLAMLLRTRIASLISLQEHGQYVKFLCPKRMNDTQGFLLGVCAVPSQRSSLQNRFELSSSLKASPPQQSRSNLYLQLTLSPKDVQLLLFG